MKSYLASLTTVLMAGAMFLGLGLTADAHQSQYDSGAARVSFIHGDLSTQHSDSGEWVAATLNTPILNGDHISTGRRSRAEIQLDHANVLRLSDESTANVANLSRTQIQLQVGQGLVNYDVLYGSEADVEIDTPNVAVRPQMNVGSYRIMVNSDGETIVDVRKGSAEISTPQGSTRVDKGQRITIEGNADNAQFNVSEAYSQDDWDKWNRDRDHTIESAESWHHTNRYYTGSQDLDAYGHWSDVPDYGSVWFPAADPGWAPYRDGRWVYEPGYDWTWVSYEPWGWAPYHYGRWFDYGGRWGWWPGPVYEDYRPIWAPAYVSFFGFGGGGWDVGIGFGLGGGFSNVGWLPCGPGDRFFPWYGAGVNQVNVINIYNINNEHERGFEPLGEGRRGFSNVDRAFTDEHVRAGISSMGSDQFGRARVPAHQQAFDTGSLRQARVLTGAHPVAPAHESFRPSDRQVNPTAIPNRAATNQRFFSNARQGGSPQGQQVQGGVNHSGKPQANQAQQNAQRPGFRNFGSRDTMTPAPTRGGNVSPGNQRGVANTGRNQPQQNADRPGFRSFGPRDSGTMNPPPARGGNVNQGNQPGAANTGRNQPQQNADRPGFRSFGSHETMTPAPARGGNVNSGNQPGVANTGRNQPQQNADRPGFRSFGSHDTGTVNPAPARGGNVNSGNQRGVANTGRNQPQQNADRPGFRSFGPRNSGNVSGGLPPQTSGHYQERNQEQRTFTPPPPQRQNDSAPSGREGNWRTFNPPSHQSQPDGGARNYGGPSGGQSRPNYSQPPQPPRQYQNDSRGNSGNSGYSRPPLNMQQPVVTPRGGGSYSAPPPSAPRGGGSGGGAPSGGGYRGGSPGGSYSAPRSAPSGGGGNRGGYTGGGSRGGPAAGSSGGGNPPSGEHASSGQNHR